MTDSKIVLELYCHNKNEMREEIGNRRVDERGSCSGNSFEMTGRDEGGGRRTNETMEEGWMTFSARYVSARCQPQI